MQIYCCLGPAYLLNNTTQTFVSAKPTLMQTSKAVYLPGLNGLRAIAAIAVVISHITLGLNEFGLNNKFLGINSDGIAKGLDLAANGVTIFFTLSGFLITFLLLKEKEISTLNIKAFYIRRLLRIWPLYYLYFFASLITLLIFSIDYPKSSVPFYIFLAANVPFTMGRAIPFLAHYWSLGVEEQFYLFFPHLAKISNRRLLKTSSILILILLLLKMVFWLLYRMYGIELPYVAMNVSRFHVMLIGVVAAILYYNNNEKFLFFVTHKLTQLFSWICILLIAVNRFHIASVIDSELISIIAVFLILGQITRKNRIINLENKLCDFIGKISYGIYVIHPLILFYFIKLLGQFKSDSFVNYVIVYFLILSVTIIAAYISYEYFEKIFLKFKEKFTTVKSSNTKNNS